MSAVSPQKALSPKKLISVRQRLALVPATGRTTASRTPFVVSCWCRFVVVKALMDVLWTVGSPAIGRSGSIGRTKPLSGSKAPPLSGSVCSTHTTRSPAARAESTSRPTRSTTWGLAMACQSSAR